MRRLNQLERLKAGWNNAAVLTGFICAVLYTFLIKPPTADYGLDFPHFTFFALVFFVAVWWAAMNTWKSRSATRTWLALSIVCFVAGCVLYWNYQDRLHKWTVPYANVHRLRVVGDELTPDAQQYSKQLKLSNRRDMDIALLMNYAGDGDQIWSDQGRIRQRSNLLGLFYFGCALAFLSAALTVAQAAYCSTQARRK